MRRKQMKAAALQTLGLPEPDELGVDVFKPMLTTRYKLLACCLHPDKNDIFRCDTTKVFSQIRLAKEILEQELKDYQSCPRDRLRRLFEQMVKLGGYRRDRYVSEHPSGIIMNILEDGPVLDLENPTTWAVEPTEPEDPMTSSATSIDSITTVESRTLSLSPTGSPRRTMPNFDPEQPHQAHHDRPRTPRGCSSPSQVPPERPRTPRRSPRSQGMPDQRLESSSGTAPNSSGDGSSPWVLVPGALRGTGQAPLSAAMPGPRGLLPGPAPPAPPSQAHP